MRTRLPVRNVPELRASPPSRPTYQQNAHNLLKQNISSSRKTRRKFVNQVMHPGCTACDFVSQGPKLNTPRCHLSENIPPTWHCAACTQRPLRPNKFLLSRPHFSRFPLTQCNADSNRLSTISSVSDRPPQCDAKNNQSPRSVAKSQLNAKIPSPDYASCTVPSPPNYARDSPFKLRSAKILPSHRSVGILRSPGRTTGISPSSFRAPSVSPPCPSDAKPLRSQQPVSSSPPPRPSTVDKPGVPFFKRTSDNHWMSKPKEQVRPPTRENLQSVYSFRLRPACSKHTIFPVKHQRKKPLEDKSSLFPKDLIDIIGEKYDARLKVLYKNPKREESHSSIMCLAGCRKTKMISTNTTSTATRSLWR